jgi:hypothetical protein
MESMDAAGHTTVWRHAAYYHQLAEHWTEMADDLEAKLAGTARPANGKRQIRL